MNCMKEYYPEGQERKGKPDTHDMKHAIIREALTYISVHPLLTAGSYRNINISVGHDRTIKKRHDAGVLTDLTHSYCANRSLELM